MRLILFHLAEVGIVEWEMQAIFILTQSRRIAIRVHGVVCILARGNLQPPNHHDGGQPITSHHLILSGSLSLEVVYNGTTVHDATMPLISLA